MDTAPYKYKWVALIGLSLLAFTAFLDFTIVNTALPSIQRDLRASVLSLQWISNIYAMMLSMFMIVIGRFAESFGRKRIFYFGTTLFAVAALFAGMSEHILMLIIFRAFQGLGAATVFTAAITLLRYAFPHEEQNEAISIYTAITGLGLVIGPFIGGILITALSWRWVFWINIPIIIIGILCTMFTLAPEEKQHEKASLDIWGLLFLIIGLGSLNYGIIHGEGQGWDELGTMIFLFVGIASFITFIIHELHAKNPLIELRILKNPLIVSSILSCIGAGIISIVFLFFNPLYLGTIRNFSAFYIGLCIAVIPLVQVIISLMFKKLLQFFGIKYLLLISTLAAFIAVSAHYFIGQTSSIWYVLFAFLLLGINWGISNAGSVAAVNSIIPHERIGSSIGTIFTTWNISGAIFIAISSAIFNRFEFAKMNELLTQKKIYLNDLQLYHVRSALTDPSLAKETLTNYLGKKGPELLALFKQSFMSGYHSFVIAMATVTAILFILTIISTARVKDSP